MVDLDRQLGRRALFRVKEAVPTNEVELDLAIRRRRTTSIIQEMIDSCQR